MLAGYRNHLVHFYHESEIEQITMLLKDWLEKHPTLLT